MIRKLCTVTDCPDHDRDPAWYSPPPRPAYPAGSLAATQAAPAGHDAGRDR
jgi:hypothetical protein